MLRPPGNTHFGFSSENYMRPRLALPAAGFLLLLSIVTSTSIQAEQYRREKAGAPTFAKDVAPILFKNCVGCHRPGEIAPMSLLT